MKSNVNEASRILPPTDAGQAKHWATLLYHDSLAWKFLRHLVPQQHAAAAHELVVCGQVAWGGWLQLRRRAGH
eukprot:scaffold29272_cov18-Tisochrysis_lutea.AAC.1